MGTVTKEIAVKSRADEVWDAMRDFGALPERVVPGFVIESQLEGSDRIITFSSGAVARERLVSLDDARRRLVYAVVESRLGFTHHQATVEVHDEGDGHGQGCRIVWTTDFLPEEPGPMVDTLMDQGAAAMGCTFGR
jgi:hypothetical protein